MILKYGSKYGSKSINVQQYNTKQEKDILIMLLQNAKYIHYNILDEAMLILKYDQKLIDTLTDLEKRIILLKCRELSVGDEISFNFICKKCGNVNNSIAKVDNFFVNMLEDNQQNNSPMKKFKNIKIVESYFDINQNINDVEKYIVNIDGSMISSEFMDNLEVKEYENIYDEIKNNTMKFVTQITGYCSCGNHVPINLSDNLVVENMSEDSITSLYRTYSDLTYYGHYTKTDIDSLIPFERIIFVGQLNAIKDKIN